MRVRFLQAFVGLAILVTGVDAASFAVAQTAPSAVRVSVTNVTTQQGFILAALYDENAWGGAAIARVRVPVNADIVAFSLSPPSPGRYGIRLFHDVDSDGVMDANLVGIPTEPFGFSNNAPLQFGPPSFAAAAFDVGEGGATQTIALR